MLILLIAWLGLLWFSFGIGTAILHRIQGHSFERVGDRFIISIWLGIIIISITLLTVSLFLPLSSIFSLVTILFISLVAVFYKKSIILNELKNIRSSLSLFSILIVSGIILSIAAFVSRRVVWYDTGLYHFQAIRWLSQFGVVPGLALLHHRFGFTSSWFALAAPFNLGIFESHLATLTGGFILLIATLHFLIGTKRIWNNQAYFEDWFIVIALFLGIGFSVWMGMPISPSPDLPVMFLTLTIAWLFIKLEKSPTIFSNFPVVDVRLIPLLLSAGAVTFKVSSLALLLFSLIFYIINKTQKIKCFIVASLLSFVIILPLLTANSVTSGCPLYPSSFTCLELPWSLKYDQLKQISSSISSWAKWTGSPPENANSWNWIWTWLTSDKLYFLNRQTALLIILSVILVLVYQFVLKKSNLVNQNKMLLFLGVGGTIYFMVTAPTLRFGLGYLLILPSFFLGLICYNFSSKAIVMIIGIFGLLISLEGSYSYYDVHSFGQNLMLISLLLTFILLIFRLNIPLKILIILPIFTLASLSVATYLMSNQNYLGEHQTDIFGFLPPPLISNIPIITRKINDVTYFNPEKGDQCWAATLLCTPEQPKNIQLRLPKSGFGKGFIHQVVH
jgi:hypothetical protein